MREIKFRAWHKLMNKMVQVDAIDFSGGTIRKNDPCAVDDKTNGGCYLLDNLVLMQYTGLKDKNGVEIYEGDILGYPESLDDKTLYEIRWARAYSGEQWCEFRIQNISGDSIQDTEPHDYYGGISQNDYKIVVGNIFEGVDK